MSGVYIKGMQMPKDCYMCHFADREEGLCLVDGKEHGDYNEPINCPLIPVPDHGRLISADLLKADFTGNFIEAYPPGLVWAMIDDAPTIIPADKEAQT